MNIKPLSMYNARMTSFGYNKAYQNKVKRELSKSGDPRAKLVLDAEKQLLKVEDMLVAMEKRHDTHSLKFKDLSEYLIEFKPKVAYIIELLNGDLHYSDNLINQYFSEIGAVDFDFNIGWREKLCMALNPYALKDYFPAQKEPPKKEEDSQSKAELQNMVIGLLTQSEKKPEDDKINSIMTIYKPNEFSPKSLDDVIGSEEIKEKLNDDIIPYIASPAQYVQDYNDYGIRAPRGFIFYGPPGCGKTYITQALANEMGITMFMMDVSKVGSMYVNQTSKNIRSAFDYVFEKANKSQKPVIIFMDEADALAMNRNALLSSSGENEKTTATLLKMVEAARDNNTIVIAATNRYDSLDQAFKDRFDSQIYFPLPDKEQIKNLVSTSLLLREKGAALGYDDEYIDKLADMFKGYSNRSILIILDDAAKIARKRNRDNIRFEDVKQALAKTELERPSEKEYLKLSDRKRSIGF